MDGKQSYAIEQAMHDILKTRMKHLRMLNHTRTRASTAIPSATKLLGCNRSRTIQEELLGATGFPVSPLVGVGAVNFDYLAACY